MAAMVVEGVVAMVTWTHVETLETTADRLTHLLCRIKVSVLYIDYAMLKY